MKLAGIVGIFASLVLGCGVLCAQGVEKVGEGRDEGDVLPREDEENVEPGVVAEGEEKGKKTGVVAPKVAHPIESPRVYGWKEWILFEGKKKAMRAKFDSGALTSSIHGEKVKGFEKDGKKWVRFTVVRPNGKGANEDPVEYECQVVRVVRLRNADGEKSEREVVELDFWIGGEKRRAEFSLNDRDDMLNPVLLGRRVVETLGLIDVGRTYVMGANPKEAPVAEKPKVGSASKGSAVETEKGQ